MAKHSYDDDTVLQHEGGVDFNEEERYSWFEAHRQNYMQVVRTERNQKLAETDWIVTKCSEEGVPVPEEWKVYRQALRDITKTYEKQQDVVYPQKPKINPPVPDSSWKKADIQAYMDTNNISYNAGDTKADLLEKIEHA